MIDIVSFWKAQIDKWNTDEKCGLCWEFSAPLIPSQINIVQNENCCVQIYLTDIKYREEKTINQNTGLTTFKKCVWNFSIHAVTPVALGVNNYNEIKGHDIDESKWATVFYPIIECLGCDNILDYCTILGKSIEVKQNGDAILVHNYLDQNLNGWKINYQFSEPI